MDGSTQTAKCTSPCLTYASWNLSWPNWTSTDGKYLMYKTAQVVTMAPPDGNFESMMAWYTFDANYF